jgi:hypothetical protein
MAADAERLRRRKTALAETVIFMSRRVDQSRDEVLAGKVPFRARERCWPVGVPGFDAYSPIEAFFFYQNRYGPEIATALARWSNLHVPVAPPVSVPG